MGSVTESVRLVEGAAVGRVEVPDLAMGYGSRSGMGRRSSVAAVHPADFRALGPPEVLCQLLFGRWSATTLRPADSCSDPLPAGLEFLRVI